MRNIEEIRKAIADAEAAHPLVFDAKGGTWSQENGEPTGVEFVYGLRQKEIRQIWSRDIVQFAAVRLGYKLANVGEAHRLLRISGNEVDIDRPLVDRVRSLLDVLESQGRRRAARV